MNDDIAFFWFAFRHLERLVAPDSVSNVALDGNRRRVSRWWTLG